MIRDIKDITIKGGCFTQETTLEGIVANRFNIIYGRNGSGKSTIARAFRTIADPNDPWADKITATVSGAQLSDADRANIHVFNEDFIDKNIRIPQEESLEAIVMTGSQVALDDQIKEQEDIRDKAKELLAQEEAKTADLQKDLDRRINAITDKLKNGGYADRGQRISGIKRRISVSGPEVVEEYRSRVADLDAASLLNQINLIISRIGAVTSTNPILWNVPKLPESSDLANVNLLLETALPTPRLDEHDSVIVRIASDELLSHYLHDAKHHFHDEELDFCPLCQRPIDKSYIGELMDKIAFVLDENRQQFNVKLDKCIELFADITLDPLPKDVYPQESLKCELCVSELNKHFKSIRNALIRKKDSPYKPSTLIDITQNGMLLSECGLFFAGFKDLIDRRNDDIKLKEALVSQATVLNKQLGCIECEPLFKDRDTAKQLLENNIQAIKDYTKEIKTASKELSRLNAQMSNTSTALDIINSLLLYVFGGDNRLQLEDYEGKGYRLLSHNAPVRPDSVSTGERNVIALAYFFADILRGQSEESGTRTEMLVVIDDPISSFDMSNRYGIIQMLTNRIHAILGDSWNNRPNAPGNRNSKVLFLTHDFHTLADLVSMRTKLKYDTIRDKDGNSQKLPAYMDLYDRQLQVVWEVKSEDYFERMKAVFDYADEDQVSRDDLIGNQIRCLLESYLTFMYRHGIDEVVTNDHIMEPIPESVRQIFKDMPARLMLNKLSHGQQFVETPVSEYGIIMPDELQRLARQLLVFIYYTNPNHLFASLGRNDYFKVKDWAEEMEYRYGVLASLG